MTRKVLQAGPFTLAVSLPMAWVKRFKIRKGDDLYVEEKGSSIEIKTKNSTTKDCAVINVSELSEMSPKVLGIMYKQGYKKITAIYDPKGKIDYKGKQITELELIRNTFNNFAGMQIWEVKKNESVHSALCIEKATLESSEFEKTFNQLYFHVINQAERALECIQSRTVIDEALLVETLINQNSDFCIRVLISTGHEQYNKTVVYYDYSNKLESIGDYYFSIIRLICDEKNEVDKNTIYLLKKNLDLLRDSASLHRSFDSQKMGLFAKNISIALKECEDKISLSKNHGDQLSYVYAFLVLQVIYEITETLYALNNENFKENLN